jgi:4-hydroxy-2-oxoheptanedioate aldolase
LGKPGEIFDEEVIFLIEEIISNAMKHNKKVGIFCDTPDGVKKYHQLGVDMIAYSVDINLYSNAVKEVIQLI